LLAPFAALLEPLHTFIAACHTWLAGIERQHPSELIPMVAAASVRQVESLQSRADPLVALAFFTSGSITQLVQHEAPAISTDVQPKTQWVLQTDVSALARVLYTLVCHIVVTTLILVAWQFVSLSVTYCPCVSQLKAFESRLHCSSVTATLHGGGD